jgi:malate synthase
VFDLARGTKSSLQDPLQFVGFRGEIADPSVLLLCHHGLHIEIIRNREDRIGRDDPAGIADVFLESALTTILDLEDSVAAVDADDKVVCYRNLLGLMKGDLTASIRKGAELIERRLQADRVYDSPHGGTLTRCGRSLMLIRIVGHHLTTDIVMKNGEETPEAILDAMVTALIGMHDLRSMPPLNSRTRSIYIVKPKMHGSAEVAFAGDLFARVEAVLGLAPNTLKIGLMDEERRTSINLQNCMAQVPERLVFINTGFLDRTGDEIHTDMEAGPVVRKSD